MRTLLPLLFLAASSTSMVQAEEMLFVSPMRIEMSGAENTAVLSIANKSDTVKRYTIEAIDQAMNANGVTETVDSFPYSAKRMLRFMPRKVVLEPGQRQVVRVMAKRPEELPNGDYHTHILFKQEASTPAPKTRDPSPGPKFALGTLYSVAIPVVVQQGEVTSTITFTGATPALVPNKGNMIQAGFRREGNGEGKAFITVQTKDGANLVNPRQVRLYREVTDATISMPVIDKMVTYHGPAMVKVTTGNEATATVISESTVTIP